MSAARPPPGLRGLGLPIEPITGFAHSAGLLSSPGKVPSIWQVIEKRTEKGAQRHGQFREIRDITDFRVLSYAATTKAHQGVQWKLPGHTVASEME
jgi:hypothetical protein